MKSNRPIRLLDCSNPSKVRTPPQATELRWSEQEQLLVSKAEVIQSMRSGVFADSVVLGSQYQDQPGELHWYFTLFPAHISTYDPKIRRVSGGIMPDEITRVERKAIAQAILLWESEPASKPN